MEVEEVCSSDSSETEKPSLRTQTKSGPLVKCAYRILSFCFTELSIVSDSHNFDMKSSDNNLSPTSQNLHYSYISSINILRCFPLFITFVYAIPSAWNNLGLLFKTQFQISLARSDYFFSYEYFVYMGTFFIMLSIIAILDISLLHKNEAYSLRSAVGERDQR